MFGNTSASEPATSPLARDDASPFSSASFPSASDATPSRTRWNSGGTGVTAVHVSASKTTPSLAANAACLAAKRSLHCAATVARRARHRLPPPSRSARSKKSSAARQTFENSARVDRVAAALDAIALATAPCAASVSASTASDAAADAAARSPAGKAAHAALAHSSVRVPNASSSSFFCPRPTSSSPSPRGAVPSALRTAERTISARAKCPANAAVTARTTTAKTEGGRSPMARWIIPSRPPEPETFSGLRLIAKSPATAHSPTHATHAARTHARASAAAARPHARMASAIRPPPPGPVRSVAPRVSASSGGSNDSRVSAAEASPGLKPARRESSESSSVSRTFESSSSSSSVPATPSMPASLAAARTAARDARVVAGDQSPPPASSSSSSSPPPPLPPSTYPTDPGWTLAARTNSATSASTTSRSVASA